MESRLYMRTDYKLHTKAASKIPDHCATYGLSDPKDRNYQADCTTLQQPHQHDMRCPRCETAKKVLQEILDMAQKLVEEKRKAINNGQQPEAIIVAEHELGDIKKAVAHVEEFKRHQLRATRSERHKIDLIDGLSEGTAFLWMDFAQKLLAIYSRETQAQYFAKRGMVWHLTSITTIISGKKVHHTMVHIMEDGKQVIKHCESFNFRTLM
jgi:hypothetical protein